MGAAQTQKWQHESNGPTPRPRSESVSQNGSGNGEEVIRETLAKQSSNALLPSAGNGDSVHAASSASDLGGLGAEGAEPDHTGRLEGPIRDVVPLAELGGKEKKRASGDGGTAGRKVGSVGEEHATLGGNGGEAKGSVGSDGGNRASGAVESQEQRSGGLESDGHLGGTEDATHEDRSIVRATARITLDLRKLSPECPHCKKGEGKHTPSDAELVVRRQLSEVSRAAVTATNAVMRALARDDEDRLDAFLAEHGRMPHTAREWPAPIVSEKAWEERREDHQGRSREGGAKLVMPNRIVATVARILPDSIGSCVARNAARKWSQHRWDVLVRQTETRPHARVGGSIPIKGRALKFVKEEDGGFALRARLVSETHDASAPVVRLSLDARDAAQLSLLESFTLGRDAADGEQRYQAAIIEQDRLRPWKWYLRVSYSRKIAMRKTGVRCAVNLGIRYFLVAVTETGARFVVDGKDIESYLRQVERRRRDYQNQSKYSNRWGHGRRRTLEPIVKLQGKAERWRETRIQTIARQFARWCAKESVAEVVWGDFTGIRDGEPEKMEGGERVWKRVQSWPYFQQQTRGVSCLEEEGIASRVEPAHYDSQRCPYCGNTDAAQRDLKEWIIRCKSCRRIVQMDVGACMNALARELGKPKAEEVGETSMRPGRRKPREKQRGRRR